MQLETITYSNLPLETWLDAELTRLEKEAANDAIHLANRSLPALTGDSFSNYFEHSKFQTLIDSVREKLPGDSIIFDVQQTKAAAEQEKIGLGNKKKELQDTSIAIEAQAVQKPARTRAHHLWLYPVIISIALLEGYFSKPVFDGAGLSNRVATVCSFLLAGVLAAFYHGAVPIATQGKTYHARLARAALMVIILILFFWFVAVQRAYYLTAQAKESGDSIEYTPWFFFITSVALSMLAMALPTVYKPGQQEKTDQARYDVWITEKNRVAQELVAIEKRLSDIDAETAHKTLEAARLYEFGNSLERRIIGRATTIYNQYRKLNISHRTDGIPDCFREPFFHKFNTHFNYKNHE